MPIDFTEQFPEYLEVPNQPDAAMCSWCGVLIPRWGGVPMPNGIATPDRLHTDWHKRQG